MTSLAWNSTSDSELKYLVGGIGSELQNAYTLDTSNGVNVLAEREILNVKNIITNDSTNSGFNITPGDILVISILTGSNKLTSATLYNNRKI